mgnify:CR=1 FL=1
MNCQHGKHKTISNTSSQKIAANMRLVIKYYNLISTFLALLCTNRLTRLQHGQCACIEGPMNVIVYMGMYLKSFLLSSSQPCIRSRRLVILTDRTICMAACITSIILPEITQLCVASHDFVILIHSELLTLKLNS